MCLFVCAMLCDPHAVCLLLVIVVWVLAVGEKAVEGKPTGDTPRCSCLLLPGKAAGSSVGGAAVQGLARFQRGLSRLYSGRPPYCLPLPPEGLLQDCAATCSTSWMYLPALH